MTFKADLCFSTGNSFGGEFIYIDFQKWIMLTNVHLYLYDVRHMLGSLPGDITGSEIHCLNRWGIFHTLTDDWMTEPYYKKKKVLH